MLYIVPKHFVQFACNFLVKDESVRLVVVPEAAAVQVCGAYRAENIVDHHDFGMVETAIVHIDSGPPFHQFVKFVEAASGVNGISEAEETIIVTSTPRSMVR